jgi:RHS repeat-associated protein
MIVPGKFDVSATGGASYGIPIVVPPGTSGMVPALSLSYSSQSGDGIVGIGWNLTGLPAINRCPRTIAQDSGVHGSVNYDANDRFCMNGQRLILISGTYGADGSEYRTEIESFSRVIAHGSAGSGPAWFEVHTKTGQIMQFGNTTDSRILVVDAQTLTPTTTARAWSVNKISDTVGNYLTVTYNCADVSGSCTDASRTTYGQSYPLEVDYTGNAAAGVSPYNSVRFSYTNRTDTAPFYQAGGVSQTTVVLTRIQTYQSSNLVSDYQLAYRAGTSVLHSRLTSVTLCDGGSPQQCLKPTTFGWQGGTGYLSMTATAQPLAAAQGNQILPGDFNGDGLTDLINVKSNACSPYNVYVGGTNQINPVPWGTLSTPADGAPSCTVTPQTLALTGPNSIPYVLLPITAHRTGGDENDGVLVFSHGSNFQVQSFPFTTATTPVIPGDFNGDGYIDFLLQQSPTSYAYMGDGSGGFTADGGHSGLDPTNTQLLAADFDGDGCTDLLATATTGGGTNSVIYFCNPAASSTSPPSVSGYTVTLGDFNGDGKTDILLTTSSGPGKLYFSTGIGFTLSSCSIPSSWGNYNVTSSNWDGDGKADLLLIPKSSPGTSQLWVSTGSCFAQAVDNNGNPITINTVTTSPHAVLADWNNDGVTDIWMQEPFNTSSGSPANDALYTFAYQPELMVSVSNGIGAQTNVTYDRLNQNGSFYTKGNTATFPNVDVDGAFYVVREADAANGLGICAPPNTNLNCFTSTYTYAGGQTNLAGRDFLGFAQITVTDVQNHTVQTTNYNLGFPYNGTVASQTRTYIGNTHALSTATNTYSSNSGCSVSPATGVYFVCLTQTVLQSYDLNDTAQFPSSTTNYTYDSYGNALTVAVSLSDGSSKTTTNTYNNDTTRWYLGRLLTAAVNSIVGSSNLTRHSSFTYDTNTGLLTQETVESGISTCNSGSDPCTLSTAYTYDVFGNRITSQVFGTGITTRMTYAGFDPLGEFQTYAMNALGQAETWAHDARFGSPTTHTGPNGLATNWAYDTFGRALIEVRPDGTRTVNAYNYCAGSCPTNAAFYAQSQSLAYDNSTQIGPTSTAYFDLLSRTIAADTQGFDGSNIRVSTTFDAVGRVYQTSRPYFTSGGTPKLTTLSYDALGRVIQTVAPDSSTTLRSYNGLVTAVTNSLGETTTTTQNAEGLNASVQDAAGKTTSYTYDAFGNLLTVTDPAGNVVTNHYDIRGNKYQSDDPDMGTWTYVHDVLGELTSQTDAKSQVVSLTYDLLGRVLTRSESGLYSSWTFGTSVTFHNVGQLIEAKTCTNSGCSTVVSDKIFSFDNLGRPITNTQQMGGNYFSYRTSYNVLNGQVESTAYPSSFVLGQSYNKFGYVCALAEDAENFGCNLSGAHVIERVNSRDAELHLTQSTAGNGVITNNAYDPNTGLPLSIRAGTGGAVASFDYAFDTIGNLRSRTDNNESYTEGFCYDPMNRLTNYAVTAPGGSNWNSAWGSMLWTSLCGSGGGSNWGSVNWGAFGWGACIAPGCKAVAYDSAGLGNITGKSDVGAYSYPTAGSARPHAVSSITGTVDGLTNPIYAYDANGNLTCESTGSGCTGTIGRQVSVTAFNMADTITQGTTTVAFTYDDQHQRIQQSATVSGTTTTTTYLNDAVSGAASEEVVVGTGAPTWVDYVKLDGKVIAQRSSTFTSATWGSANWGSLVWGSPITASNWGAHNWAGFNWAGAAVSSWSYFTLDHLGSVAVITDASGAVIQRLSYDAWGRQRNPNGTDATCGSISSGTTRGFTNQEQMPVSCLINLNARIYDPTLGRFMAADPVVGDPYSPNSFNRYGYVDNNPLSFTDTTGLCFLGCFWKSSIFKVVLMVAIAVTLPVLEFGGTIASAASALAESANVVAISAANGAIAGAVSAGVSGGNILQGAAFGALSGGLAAAAAPIGTAIGADLGGTTVANAVGQAVAQGAAGGVVSVAEGGDFGSGFLAAGVGSLGGSLTSEIEGHSSNQFNAGALAVSTVAGGLGSVLGGGKFENGAMSGAFAYVAAYAASNISASESSATNSNLALQADGDGSLAETNDSGNQPYGQVGSSNAGKMILADNTYGGGGQDACSTGFQRCIDTGNRLHDLGYQTESHELYLGCRQTVAMCYNNESTTQSNPFIDGIKTYFPPNKAQNGGGYVSHEKGFQPVYVPPSVDPLKGLPQK